MAPDQVLCFGGAQEAIFVLLNVLLGAGDHAVVVWPAYQSLHEVARAVGAEVTLVALEPDRAWELDLTALRSAVTPATRLIIVNFPHNPTGALPDRATFEALVSLAEEAGAYLFSDEVYRLLEEDPADRLPAAADLSDQGISLGGTSKLFGLAGLRIGWLATADTELLHRCAAFKDYLSICGSAPSEILALIALRARDALLGRSRAIIQGNLSRLDRFFTDWAEAFDWVRPRGGTVGFPRLLADLPIDRFAAELVEDEGVLLLPGSIYDYPGNHFRLGFGRSDLPEALSRLERFAAGRLGRPSLPTRPPPRITDREASLRVRVLDDRSVRGDERYALQSSRRDQHPVNRISVHSARELRAGNQDLAIQRKKGEARSALRPGEPRGEAG